MSCESLSLQRKNVKNDATCNQHSGGMMGNTAPPRITAPADAIRPATRNSVVTTCRRRRTAVTERERALVGPNHTSRCEAA